MSAKARAVIASPFVVTEAAFRAGQNDVELFWVRPTGAGHSLAPITPD